MKTVGLILAMLVLFCGASFTDTMTVTFGLYQGYETVACPIVPINPEPSTVFNGLDFENGSPSLQRLDAVTKNMVTYDYWSQPDAIFGGILLGDGYLVWNDGTGSGVNTVTGVPDGVPDSTGRKTDMWISLPKHGWSLIGMPYDTAVPINQDTGDPILFTDGNRTLRWDAAVSAGWVSDNIQRWSGTEWKLAGWNYYDEEKLTPGKGYYIYTNVDNITMIVPANP